MGKEGRVFLRGMTSQTYGLSEFRNMQLEHNRVRSESVVTDDAKVAHSGDSEESRTWWKIGPGDDFRTARKHVIKRKEGTDPNSGHKHERKAPFLQHHLDSLTAAGFSQITTGWQAFYTYLIMARKG